jgi:antirestriction protein ArdC
MTNKKIYETVTNKILELLSQGIIPWMQPWHDGGPKNMLTGKYYRGVNIWLLSHVGETPYWMTFKQAKKLGGKIRKGEKGEKIIFFNWQEKLKINEKGEEHKILIPLLRFYTVFNLSQTEGINPPSEEADKKTNNPIKEADRIINDMPQKPEMSHGGDMAAYYPSTDKVVLPYMDNFINTELYYSVAFHELAHSTGHKSRLARKEIIEKNSFGSHDYSKEELVAEMTAAFLCGVIGIENKTIQDSVAYGIAFYLTSRLN